MRHGVVKRGSTWSYVVSVTDIGTGKRSQKWVGGFATRQEAMEARTVTSAAILRGEYADRRQVTVAEYLEAWLSNLDVKPKTLAMYRYNVERYIVPALGAVQLQALRPRHVSRLHGDLSATPGRGGTALGYATVSSVHRTLRAALTVAISEGILTRNVAVDAGAPRRPRGNTARAESRALSLAELRSFLRVATRHRLGALFVLTANTGARRGEMLYLRWSHLDLDNGQVTIEGSRGLVDNKPMEGPTKTGTPRRVSIGRHVVDAMIEHREAQLAERALAGDRWLGAEDGYVFCRGDGRPIHPDTPSKLMRDFAEAAGVRRVRFHDLRHTHASLLLAGGLAPHVVGGRLGHANPTTTMSIYAHVLQERADEVGQAFADLLGR